MDIFHKMNPFTRPSSRQATSSRERQSLDYYARPSSSLESNLPSLPESDCEVNSLELQRRYLTTPGPQTPKRHARTPSLLRSLAHHPSLSALRSKKKEKRKGKKGFTEMPDEPVEWRGLKGSKSVPRDLGCEDG